MNLLTWLIVISNLSVHLRSRNRASLRRRVLAALILNTGVALTMVVITSALYGGMTSCLGWDPYACIVLTPRSAADALFMRVFSGVLIVETLVVNFLYLRDCDRWSYATLANVRE